MLAVPSLVVGLGASAVAALLLSSGTVLQAVDSRRVDGEATRLSLLGRLLRRPVWLLGTVVGYLAFPFQLIALGHAPLIVVQPVHACGLLLVLFAGVRLMRERLAVAELGGAVAIVIGLAVLSWGAPTGAETEVSGPALAGVALALAATALIPFGLGSRCGRSILIVTSALGFAGANLAVKGFSDHLGSHDYLPAAGYLAIAALGSVAAVVNQMSAFQRYRAVEVVPLTFAIPTFLPALLGVFLLNERWASAALAGAPFAVGGLILVIGTVAVGRAGAVASVSARAAA